MEKVVRLKGAVVCDLDATSENQAIMAEVNLLLGGNVGTVPLHIH